MVVARSLTAISPVRLRAEVVRGFGRGSRELGFPTANLRIPWGVQDLATLSEEERVVLDFATRHDTGIYCALCSVEGLGNSSGVHKVAMSMGWNPTFADVKAKTIEPWILHQFQEDFYGRHIRLLVVGYVRPEVKFEGLEELKQEIQADGEFCSVALDGPELAHFRDDAFLAQGLVPLPAVPRSCFPAGVAVGGGLRAVLLAAPPLRPTVTRLLLARHGETLANAGGFLCGGGNDSELTARGRAQAERLGEELASLQEAVAGAGADASPALRALDLVGSSQLRRAVASADAVAQHFPEAARMTLETLREMSYGDLEGARIADVRGELAALDRRWRGGDTRARVGGVGGESLEDVLNRVLEAIRALLHEHHGRTVLLVCHSWVNKVLIAAVTPGMGLHRVFDVPQRNGAVNVLDFHSEENGTLAPRFEVLGVDLLAGDEVPFLSSSSASASDGGGRI